MDQYKKNILQSINLTEAVDAYGKELQNLSKSDDDLKKITYRTCDSHVMRLLHLDNM